MIEGLPGTGADVSRLFPGPLAQFLPALRNVLEHAGNINSSPAIHLSEARPDSTISMFLQGQTAGHKNR